MAYEYIDSLVVVLVAKDLRRHESIRSSLSCHDERLQFPSLRGRDESGESKIRYLFKVPA
jgi:hypothetical protein